MWGLGGGWPSRRTSLSATPAPTGPGRSGSPGSWKPKATRPWSRLGTSPQGGTGRMRCSGLPPPRTGWGGVLSAAYLESGHGEAEWRAFYAKDPSGERGLLLPVRVGNVEPPGLLTTRIYVDLVGRDATSARSALLAAARGARGKPTEEPEFPGAQQSQVSVTEAPRFPGELRPVWNVPFPPNPFFIGRSQVLADLEARLHSADGPVGRVVLVGLGGVGKTSVAVEFVYQRQADYELVWCVNGEQPTSLL